MGYVYEPVPLIQDFLKNARSCKCGKIFCNAYSWYDHVCDGCPVYLRSHDWCKAGEIKRHHKNLQFVANQLWPSVFEHPFLKSQYYSNFTQCPANRGDRNLFGDLYGKECQVCETCKKSLDQPLFVIGDKEMSKAPRWFLHPEEHYGICND